MPLPPDQAASFQAPTVVANRFVIVAGATVRIAFGEQAPQNGETIYHQAVLLSREDAYELKQQIEDLLASSAPPKPKVI